MTVGARVRTVEQSHARNAPLARLEHQRRQRIAVERVVEQLCQCVLHERVDLLVLVSKRIRVLDVGGQPLQAVRRQLAQTADILVLRCEHADRLGLRLELCTLSRPMRRLGQLRRICNLREQIRLQRERLLDHVDDRLTVEVRIRDRDEEVHRHAMVDLDRNLLALCAQLRRHRTEPLRHIDEQILHLRDIRLLAADALHRAALTACCLLTLITKHFSIHEKLSFAIIHICCVDYSKGSPL